MSISLLKLNSWSVVVAVVANIFAFAPSLEGSKGARKTKALPFWGASSREHRQPLWRVWGMEGFSWIPCYNWNTTNILVIFLWQGYLKKKKAGWKVRWRKQYTPLVRKLQLNAYLWIWSSCSKELCIIWCHIIFCISVWYRTMTFFDS